MAFNDYSTQMPTEEDQIRMQAAAPMAAPTQSSGAPDFDLDALKQQASDAQDQKRKLAMLGGIGDAQANTQSFGNFFLGRMNPHNDVSGAMKAQSDTIADPTEKYTKTLEAYKAAMQGKQLKRDSDKADRMLDPNSDETKQAQAIGGAIYDSMEKSKVVSNPEALARFKAALTSGSAQSIHDTVESSKMLQELAKEAIAGKRADAQTQHWAQMFGNRQELQDNNIHQKILGRLQNDKQLGQRLVQYQNLDNTLNNFMNADHVTKQQVEELQQGIRGNLGIKGGSGVGEREAAYIHTLGMNAANLKQFITGDPADIAKDSALINHLKQLAQLEQGNIKKQYSQRLKTVTSGNDALYSRRPELKMGLDDAISNYSNAIGGDQPAPGQPPAPPAGGGGIISSANANGPETRSIGGMTYVKVPGGWKKQ